MSFFFDPTNVDLSNTIPEGNYNAVIIEIEDKVSKNGGSYLKLQLKIIDNDKYEGRVIFDIINYRCANEQAMSIAARSIAQIIVCKFGEKRAITNEQDLLMTVVGIQVGHQINSQTGDKEAKVKFYKQPAKQEDTGW